MDIFLFAACVSLIALSVYNVYSIRRDSKKRAQSDEQLLILRDKINEAVKENHEPRTRMINTFLPDSKKMHINRGITLDAQPAILRRQLRWK